jgi:hypothetical protein
MQVEYRTKFRCPPLEISTLPGKFHRSTEKNAPRLRLSAQAAQKQNGTTFD